MPKINVYLSDELAAAVKDADLPVSSICQRALERAVRNVKLKGDVTTALVMEASSGPFERATPRAKAAVALAEKAAIEHQHNYIGTEHLLLGLIDQGENLGVKVLAAMDVEPDAVRHEVVAAMGPPSPDVGPDDVRPYTRLAVATFEIAARAALGLGHNYLGGEHLLLGLVENPGGLAGEVLRGMGVEAKATRRAVVAALSGYTQAKQNAAAAMLDSSGAVVTEHSPPADALAALVERIDRLEQRLNRSGN
jgi:ATP-dependent Clp protease ATP-binding subunit ClpC